MVGTLWGESTCEFLLRFNVVVVLSRSRFLIGYVISNNVLDISGIVRIDLRTSIDRTPKKNHCGIKARAYRVV